MSFVLPVCTRLTQRGLTQCRTTIILAILLLHIMLTKCTSTTILTIVLRLPMWTRYTLSLHFLQNFFDFPCSQRPTPLQALQHFFLIPWVHYAPPPQGNLKKKFKFLNLHTHPLCKISSRNCWMTKITSSGFTEANQDRLGLRLGLFA